MRNVAVIGLAVTLLAGGCGKSRPTLAGGKPVSHWVQALQDPDARVRKQAAFKLGNVGPSDAAALPALMGALKDRHAAVRREAILALLKCGPGAKEAIPALVELRQRDEDREVQTCAGKALENLQREK